MLSKRCRLGAATLNGKLYVCGGYDGSTFLRTVEVYDPITSRFVYFSNVFCMYIFWGLNIFLMHFLKKLPWVAIMSRKWSSSVYLDQIKHNYCNSELDP